VSGITAANHLVERDILFLFDHTDYEVLVSIEA